MGFPGSRGVCEAVEGAAVKRKKRQLRNAVIERCARAVEKQAGWAGRITAKIFAKSVRALKR